MNNFWQNISRYPRFFISSMVGLISIILAPLRNLFKVSRLRGVLVGFIFLVIGFLVLIIKNMVGL